MEDLKPCPFCNSSAMSHTDSARSLVGCFYAECGVNPSLSAITIELASEVWNKRVDDRLVEENAELREALSIIKQMIYSMKTNAHTFSNENVEEIAKEGRSAMTLIDKLLNK